MMRFIRWKSNQRERPLNVLHEKRRRPNRKVESRYSAPTIPVNAADNERGPTVHASV